jgi:hypothetical protein
LDTASPESTPDAQFLFSSRVRLNQSLANRILGVEAQTFVADDVLNHPEVRTTTSANFHLSLTSYNNPRIY